MSAVVALFYLRRRKVGTEFNQETTGSDSDDDSSCSAIIVIQISVSSFMLTVSFFQSRPSVIVTSLMELQKQDNGTARVGKALKTGSCLTDKVTKSYFNLIYTCSRKFIYLVERRLIRQKTVLKNKVGLLSTKNFALLCIRSRPA